MIRPIDIRLNAAHPDLPLAEAVTYTGAPSTVLIRGVPGNCGRWAITAVFVAATFPDGSTTTRTAVQSANGVWVATLPATATSGRTAHGLRILADGADENGEAVGGYILGVADFAVASLAVTPAPEPGETSWQMLYFDAVPGVLRKGDVTKVDGVLKLYNGTALEAFAPSPSTSAPQMDGTAAPGTSAAYARGDHVHPTDTSRVPTSRTVNGQSLDADVELTSEDIPYTDYESVDEKLGSLDSTIGSHVLNTTIHVTAAEKSTWNGKQDALSAQQLANIAAVPSKADKPATFTTGNLAQFDSNGNPTDASWTAGNLARYSLATKTISNGAVTLDDRAMNAVAVSSSLASLTVNFPTATSGKVRDFGLRLTVVSGITTAPELVLPQGITFENADGEVPEIGSDGAATLLYFTETAAGVFLVKGEVVTAIS